MAEVAEAKAVKLEDETIKVIWTVLFKDYPPTNPAVVLKAMRNWYLEYGNGPVLRALTDWLIQIVGYSADIVGTYKLGQTEFTEKTALTAESNPCGAVHAG
jgi:hypothetical protein